MLALDPGFRGEPVATALKLMRALISVLPWQGHIARASLIADACAGSLKQDLKASTISGTSTNKLICDICDSCISLRASIESG